ncbi:NUDIX hydrolase [Kribbella deserti]|uniref:NUDIX hydrolase n=1 Tax=Kribbella deserti TaxID=1926257 RepID=A0ABV6QGT9_9ACTN
MRAFKNVGGGWQGFAMDIAVDRIYRLVEGIRPFDELESAHRSEALQWLTKTADVFRRSKPATPSPHLVSYVVLLDPTDGSSLLVDHLNARRWLPPGGHVEPGEDPADTARREAQEELGITPRFARADAFTDPAAGRAGASRGPGVEGAVAGGVGRLRVVESAPVPAFITITETVGIDHGHTDVSLWYVLIGQRGMPLTPDPAEFREARWWTPAEIDATDATLFDPHYQRFIAKLNQPRR